MAGEIEKMSPRGKRIEQANQERAFLLHAECKHDDACKHAGKVTALTSFVDATAVELHVGGRSYPILFAEVNGLQRLRRETQCFCPVQLTITEPAPLPPSGKAA